MTKTTTIRILLVDDDVLVREGLRSALQAYPNIQVIGEAGDGEAALVRVEQLRPNVVLMDINMQRMDGVTATRLIKARYPEIAVVGLSVEQKDYQRYAMQRAGASEVVVKENAAVALYGAIQTAVAAIQPILVLKETPESKLQLEELQPSTNERMSEDPPVESPPTGPDESA